jgi:hypothetical protein
MSYGNSNWRHELTCKPVEVVLQVFHFKEMVQGFMDFQLFAVLWRVGLAIIEM